MKNEDSAQRVWTMTRMNICAPQKGFHQKFLLHFWSLGKYILKSKNELFKRYGHSDFFGGVILNPRPLKIVRRPFQALKMLISFLKSLRPSYTKQLPRPIWLYSEVFKWPYAPFFLSLWALFSFINCLCDNWTLVNYGSLPKSLR